MSIHHLHLVSDATGETVNSVARACLVQFEGIEPIEHAWTLVRTKAHMTKVLAGIAATPGPVLYTMVNSQLRDQLIEGCLGLGLPCISLLDPVIHALAGHYKTHSVGRPGKQHELDSEYFNRIEAMNFAMIHDDGQLPLDIDQAEVSLVGVSRTSKTPTCIYLANRGIRACNMPVVPGVALPDSLARAKKPLVVGLTKDPRQLTDIRRNRLRMMAEKEDGTDYTDLNAVKAEVAEARRLCTRYHWPVIDVTRRSIEETAAAIMTLLQSHKYEPSDDGDPAARPTHDPR